MCQHYTVDVKEGNVVIDLMHEHELWLDPKETREFIMKLLKAYSQTQGEVEAARERNKRS